MGQLFLYKIAAMPTDERNDNSPTFPWWVGVANLKPSFSYKSSGCNNAKKKNEKQLQQTKLDPKTPKPKPARNYVKFLIMMPLLQNQNQAAAVVVEKINSRQAN